MACYADSTDGPIVDPTSEPNLSIDEQIHKLGDQLFCGCLGSMCYKCAPCEGAIENDDELLKSARLLMEEILERQERDLRLATTVSRRDLKLFELHECHRQKASIVIDGEIRGYDCQRDAKATILLDSGALGSSYVSKAWVDNHRWAVRSSREVNDTVTLGDGATSLAINEEVQLLVELKGPSGARKSEVVQFRVMDTGFDFIVGLPDIEDKFLEIFIDLLRMGAARRAKCMRVE